MIEDACSPFPIRQNLDYSELKEFADDNFRFDENGRKFFKRVQNTVRKGEIAHYEQFLLFTQCFRLVPHIRENQGLFGKGLTRLLNERKEEHLFSVIKTKTLNHTKSKPVFDKAM